MTKQENQITQSYISPDARQLPLFELDFTQPEALRKTPITDTSNQPHADSQFSKYIIYVDESGDHSLQSIDKEYPLFALAFCVFHKRHYSEHVVSALEKFKFNHFGHDQVILHETEIRKEKGAFNIFRSRDQKFQFLNELTDIIEHSNFILLSCVIDKRALRKQTDLKANPYHIALGFCLEILYEFLQEKEQHGLKTHVVVECRGKKKTMNLNWNFADFVMGTTGSAVHCRSIFYFLTKKLCPQVCSWQTWLPVPLV